ncbi:hypothetical protein ACIBQX_11355 [Nonomuraea sp. NPDC049714]|uniref:hypothetical protein n=1 Tax=Nonomuraea sp. NPDC049714 TaxID=3364357 RepID=UPI0037A4C9D1
MPEQQALVERVPLAEATGGQAPKNRKFRARIIAGDVQGSSGFYPAAMLRQDGPAVFVQGLPVFLDHPGVTEAYERPERSVRDLAGHLATTAVYEGDGLYADVEVYPHWAPVIEAMAEHIGMSIRAFGTVEASTEDNIRGPIVTSLAEASSVDFVTAAGAGGKIVALLESARAQSGDLLRSATEAKAPPFKKKDAKGQDDDSKKPDDAEDVEPDEDDDEEDLPPFLKGKVAPKSKPAAKVSEARNVGHWLESRIHRLFTEMCDDMFGEGRLSRDERIGLSQAIGEGLTAFNAKVADQMPHLYERDLWDDPSPPVAADAANPENPAPTEVAESKNEPGSSPAVENEREVGMPELTEAQARELEEARTTAEADKAAALQEAADAKLMLARFTALEAARPIATKVLAESGLPAGAQAKLLAAVTSESVPLTGENTLDESALKTSVEEAAKAESTYLASLAEGEGAGQVRGLGESATSSASSVSDAATVTALEETYKSRGLSPEAARLAAVGRP